MNHPCKICQNTEGNQTMIAREMMLGTRDQFLYFRCSVCGCLQIGEFPENIAEYYPENYYSYGKFKEKKYFLWRFFVNWYLHGPRFPLLPAMAHIKGYTAWLDVLKDLKKDAAIIDIGCGSGELLYKMHVWGFKNLTGIEPYNAQDIEYPYGVKILKKDIVNYHEKADLIMLHHAFEHVENPHEIMKHLSGLLNPGGKILIRIPVSDSFAFRKYGVDWYQLDAPRHFFLHTTNSINLLAQANGLTVKEIIYDSTKDQLLDSEKYARNIILSENLKISRNHKKSCKKMTRHLNEIQDGDQACFILQK